MWSGSLSFGLVNVPVSLLSAVRDQDLHFHQLEKDSHVRLHVERVCRKEDRPVPYEEIAHGYEADDGYVLLTDEELAAAAPEKTRTIDISEFVPVDEIDPVYFDHPYHLVPNADAEGALRAYQLLVKTMEDSGRAAIGHFVLRTKEYLVAIRARDGVLSLTTMLFHDEVRDTGELPLPSGKAAKPKKAQVDQAVALIEAMSAEFDPSSHHDRYRDRLKRIVERKRKGETIKVGADPETPDAPPDLMEALKASLEKAKASA
jgi:DNA end-binding protein Ku